MWIESYDLERDRPSVLNHVFIVYEKQITNKTIYGTDLLSDHVRLRRKLNC
jgi:hypothetical protein